MGRWCMADDVELKKKILEKAHNIPYLVHPCRDKLSRYEERNCCICGSMLSLSKGEN